MLSRGVKSARAPARFEPPACFRIPANILRPGQYGKVRVPVETLHNALLIPQQAVSELQGSFQVAVVDQNNAVNIQADQGWRPDRLFMGDAGRPEAGRPRDRRREFKR